MKHGERIASIETRLAKVEEVQEDMVSQLKDAAEGLRALAGKIDTVVHVAKENGVCMGEDCPPRQTFSGSLNHAWRHFQDNFAIFLVYGGAGLFLWAVVKMAFFKEIPPAIRALLG